MAGALVVLGLLEVSEHIVVAPAGVAHRLPAVKVPPVPSHVYEPVDGRGAAQCLAGRDPERLQNKKVSLQNLSELPHSFRS